jgi:protein involved in polysaccharide export with SLBB domain
MPLRFARHALRTLRLVTLAIVCGLFVAPGTALSQTANRPTDEAQSSENSGPIRLRQSSSTASPAQTESQQRQLSAPIARPEAGDPASELLQEGRTPYQAGEFELFVQRQTGQIKVRRFGADLVARGAEPGVADAPALVPPEYVVAPGDEVVVAIWGSVDADLRLIVDRSGRISIPRVGTIQVAGVRHADLAETIRRRAGQVFKNFELSASVGALRGIRVFVTGFATNPGAYTLSSLSTLTAALFRAGGPSPAGSFRRIDLRRGTELVTTFDFYDFLLKGDRSGDRQLQAGDVIHVQQVGDEVAVIGSVNKPAVIELKAGETVADALRGVGGFSAVADRSRLAVERLSDRNAVRVRELSLPAELTATLSHGDVLRAFSAVDSRQPMQRQNKRIRIEGEVAMPGDYVVPPSSTLADAIKIAGGLTPGAFVYGTEFTRSSVRITQQQNYERALRDLEIEFARQGTQRATSAEEVANSTVRDTANSRLIDRLRAVKPTGRIVLQVQPDSTELPDLALEEGDRVYIPARPTSVGVFGSVFNGGSYLYGGSRTVHQYLDLAGGPTRGADRESTFVVRANGSVISSLQGTNGSWFRRGDALQGLKAEAGDTIFVPEEVDKSTTVQNAKDWTQILYQFALGIAGLRAVGL